MVPINPLKKHLLSVLVWNVAYHNRGSLVVTSQDAIKIDHELWVSLLDVLRGSRGVLLLRIHHIWRVRRIESSTSWQNHRHVRGEARFTAGEWVFHTLMLASGRA